MKTCSRCGKTLPLGNFRNYYVGKRGHYKYCKDCERIEGRRRYLLSLEDEITIEQIQELEKINMLYEKRAAAGLDVPGRSRNNTSVLDLVEAELNEKD